MFDSGVGGLTVVSALAQRWPKERVLYLGDQGHVPYGGRPLDEIRSFARGITAMLAAAPVKAVVMACNISSATAWPELAAVYGPTRIFGMVRPGARRAEEASRARRVGVLATAGTVASGAYTAALRDRDPDLTVVEVPCPKLVPLVEAGETNSDDAVAAATEYLAPIEAAGCDVVVLGCTHYPYLLDALNTAAREPVIFIDPAEAVADDIGEALSAAGMFAQQPAGPHRLMTTGDPSVFAHQVPRFLPGDRSPVHGVRWGRSPAPKC